MENKLGELAQPFAIVARASLYLNALRSLATVFDA
jgi:hypothetical protein